jgi:hypothetical protein
MFNRDALERAVKLQQKSYELLKWLSQSVDKGTVTFGRAHGAMSAPAAARDWLEHNLLNLPEACRPAEEELQEFANLFSTYLLTSFQLEANARKHLRSDCGCFCSMCSYLVSAHRLKPKKLDKRNRKRAQKLKRQHLEQLAIDAEVSNPMKIQRVADNPELASELALVAYAGELIRRSKSFVEGPAVLALWREIAWTKNGTPDRKFRLEVGAILEAERSLVERLRAS